MNKENVATDKAPKAIGPYEQAIKVGEFVYTAGQIPIDPKTGNLVEGDIAAQTRRVLENLKAVLEAAGSSLDRVVKGADGYPPYNIERCDRANGQPERLRITLAVAGFTRDQLDVTTEENQLVIRGRQQDDKARQYIHRGIAARHFQRTFVLAEGMLVLGADLKNGLLSIDLARPEPERVVKTIAINEHE